MATTDFLESLCDDEWEAIFIYLNAKELLSIRATCKAFAKIIIKSRRLAKATLLSFFKLSIFPNTQPDKLMGDDIDIHCMEQFVIPIFNSLCFDQMCLFRKTSLFQLYARLISYNWRLHLMASNHGIFKENSFKLLNVFENKKAFYPRNLNAFELLLFKRQSSGTQSMQSQNKLIVADKDTFIKRLNAYFYFDKWKNIIFGANQYENKFFLAGGSVLKCAQNKLSYSNKMKDLDFFAIYLPEHRFYGWLTSIAMRLSKLDYTVIYQRHYYERYNNTNQQVQNIYVNFSDQKSKIRKSIIDDEEDPHLIMKINKCVKQIEQEGFWTQFQFIWLGNSYKEWSILHIFDLDSCQIGFNGREVLCTYAFLQSMNTQTMINYKLTNTKSLIETFAPRIIKYGQRGFDFIAPRQFNIQSVEQSLIQFSSDHMTESTNKRWINKRRVSLHECFVEHGWIIQRMYGSGGFGLNNDYFGMRKVFANVILKNQFGGVCKDDCNGFDCTTYRKMKSQFLDGPVPEIVQASSEGQLEKVKELINAGHDVNARGMCTESNERFGCNKRWKWFRRSALMSAGRKMRIRDFRRFEREKITEEIVILLLLNGADPTLMACDWEGRFVRVTDNYHPYHCRNKRLASAVRKVYDLWTSLNPNCVESAKYTTKKMKKNVPSREQIQEIIDECMKEPINAYDLY